MEIKIIRIDKSLPLPRYETHGSVAFDFYSRSNVKIKSQKLAVISSNVIIQIPKNFFVMIVARSSLAKKGLMLSNGVGIIDQDYCGPNDEIKIFVYNFSGREATIKKGERFAQGLIFPVAKARWKEVGKIKSKSRGGFGSTGA